MLLGDPDEGLVGDEHDHEVRRRLELPPVGLRGELAEVIAHLTRMVLEMHDALIVVLALTGVEVGGQRRLRVDHDLLAARNPDDEVGTEERAFVVAGGSLLLEVAVRQHSCRFDDVPQLNLSPPPADVRSAEGLHEVPGLEPQALVRRRERRQVLGDGAVRLLPDLLHPAHLPVHPLQRVLERRDVPADLRLRNLEEGRGGLLQRLRGQRPEGVARLGDHGGSFVAGLAHERELGFELRRTAARDEPGAGAAECETEYESDDDHRADER